MVDRQIAEDFELFLADGRQPFAGWDFRHILETGRVVMMPMSWSYASVILPLLRRAHSMLDMGTGGGEFLALLQPLPPNTSATEGYLPNVPVARQRLEPLGVTVRSFAEDAELPFEDNQFDLIINRHESYAPLELLRILQSGGLFVTQQVEGTNENELNRLLGALEYDEFLHWNLSYVVDELSDAGFEIVRREEASPLTRFYDIGAVIYHLSALPWQIADFSVDRYCDQLFELHCLIHERGYIDIETPRFLIVARKP